MHELSIVTGIIDIALREAEKAHADMIEAIELDIGCLTTIEMTAFDFAWRQAIKGTLLEGCTRIVNRIEGRARCLDCDTVFGLQQVYDACTGCGSHWIAIEEGRQLSVRALTIS